jgi:hypothetical protein
MSTRSLLPLALSAIAAPAAAQSFDFPNFPNTTGLALNGSASVTGNLLQLTPAANDQYGSAYYTTPVAVSGGFTTTFTFRISNDGADGFAFIIQNDPRGTTALGFHGTSLGYSDYVVPGGLAIVNSIVVEFDTWNSGVQAGDTSANEISIHTDGVNDNRFEEAFSLGNVTPAINMSDGQVHTVRIVHAPPSLSVYLDNLVTPVLTVPYSFATGGNHIGGAPVGGLNLIGGTSAYVGFSGTTGGVTEVHEIHSWSFGVVSIGTAYCTANANSTGATGQLTALGSNVVAANALTLRASDLPLNAFGFFLTSRTQGFVMNPGGSAGNLCLAGAIGRYVGPGQIKNTGSTGAFELLLDLTATPTPTGLVQIQSGETWNFQSWHRDAVGGAATSNFTRGRSVPFL